MSINESIVWDPTLGWFVELGCVIGHERHMALGEPATEHDGFGDVALVWRLYDAIRRLNPVIPIRAVATLRDTLLLKLLNGEDARLETEQKLATQVAKTETIKQKIYWRCDRRATREALALSIVIWMVQGAIAVFGVIKIPDSSKFGWLLVTVGSLSGLIRLIGAHWEIKPLKVLQAYKEWRRACLQKNEYAALSIEDES